MQCISSICICLIWIISTYVQCEVLWAVNCGGKEHIDLNGVKYEADYLKTGIASDYGLSFTIDGVPMEDQIIYQTERYNTDDFSYDVPVFGDGDYVISLKFSEVWFTGSLQKVFHIRLEDSLEIVHSLDIFDKVGFATALDIHIPIQISNKQAEYDNPKVNAILLTKGGVEDVPKLPPTPVRKDPVHLNTPSTKSVDEGIYKGKKPKKPKLFDPYPSSDFSYFILPALMTVGAFIPILFCLCKL